MLGIKEDIFYLDIDLILKKGLDNMSDLEYDYVKSITHIFLGNLGYGRTWVIGSLDMLKSKYKLNYKEILLLYKGKQYRIKYSENTKKHGKILGFNSYILSFERPNPEPLNTFDILFDLRWIKNLSNKEIYSFMDDIESNSMKLSNVINHRLFLNESFEIGRNEILGKVLDWYFIGRQEKIVLEEENTLKSMLIKKGFYYTVELNEENVNDLKNGVRNKSLNMKIKVFDSNGKESVIGYRYFIKYSSMVILNSFIDVHVENSLKNIYNRLVSVKVYCKY